MTKLVIREGTKQIDVHQYANNQSITELVIADTVVKICDGAFYGCSNLKKITWGSRVHYIGRDAFHRCVSLRSLNFPGSIEWVGARAFASCPSLTYVEFEDNDDVDIECGAFANCTGLIFAVLPNGMKHIYGETFGRCTGLTDVFIPGTVTSIGPNAFFGVATEQIDLPDSIESIGSFAFSYTKLTNLVIPDSVLTIGSSAFWSCDNLTSIDVGKSVVCIENVAFEHCPMLNEVTFRSTIIGSIGLFVFNGCTSLKRINVPASAMATYKRLLPKYLHRKLVGF
jgi:hypothetical protein